MAAGSVGEKSGPGGSLFDDFDGCNVIFNLKGIPVWAAVNSTGTPSGRDVTAYFVTKAAR